VLEGGAAVPVGRLEVRDGHGALAVTVDVAGDRARGVRLVDDEGESGYEAQFG
jgi:hypothetical protein